MKAFIVAMLILSVMVGGSYFYAQWLETKVYELFDMAKVMDAYIFADDWSSCREMLGFFNQKWTTAYPKLSYFMYHNDLDIINQAIYELNRCIEMKNKDIFLLKNKKLQELLLRLPSGEQLSIKNIL
ncbi:MAG: DUF4363 family protein [Clostridia bacterium]|nr:DUF4363 family protein [Clostridia bacterium]